MVRMDAVPFFLIFALSGLSIWVLQEKDGDTQPVVLQVRDMELPIWAIVLYVGEISTSKAWAKTAREKKKQLYSGLSHAVSFLSRIAIQCLKHSPGDLLFKSSQAAPKPRCCCWGKCWDPDHEEECSVRLWSPLCNAILLFSKFDFMVKYRIQKR